MGIDGRPDDGSSPLAPPPTHPPRRRSNVRIHIASTRTKTTKCGKHVGKHLWWVNIKDAKMLRRQRAMGGPNCPKCVEAKL